MMSVLGPFELRILRRVVNMREHNIIGESFATPEKQSLFLLPLYINHQLIITS